MHVSKRTALGAAAIAAVAFAIPSMADQGHQSGGVDSQPCADGTVTASPNVIWPPNHKMHDITISYTAPATAADTAAGDKTTITVDAITDDQLLPDGSELQGSGPPNEGTDWSGEGATATSAEGSAATTTVQVRAERSGTVQGGRHYSIMVSCSESTANGMVPDPADSGMATLTVTVPHDQGNN